MDANTVLRAASAGNLTADETLTALALEPMTRPMYLIANVPAVSASDSLVINAAFQNSGSTELMEVNRASITAAGVYSLPIFCDMPTTSKLVVTLDTTLVGTAAGNFGAVEVYLSTSPIS
jgi:hypothetical protein